MRTQRVMSVIAAILIGALSASAFALDATEATATVEQAKDQPATNEMETTAVWQPPGFIASRVYQSAGPVYAIAGGEFDLAHNGIEIACLTADGSVLQLSPNFFVWEASVRYEGRFSVDAMESRPSIDIESLSPPEISQWLRRLQ